MGRWLIVASSLLLAGLQPFANASAQDGAALFKSQCGVCHVLEDNGEKRQGPHLHAVFGRKMGAVDGFPYSAGLKNDGRVWTAELLDAWLTDPKLVHGDSYMMYKQKDAQKRAAIISFLQKGG